jgi:Recombination endonuclease VII
VTMYNYWAEALGYNHLLAQQDGVCAICREPDRELVVDHDYRTGRVRALLCGHCNSAIGFLRESPLLARAAANYLELQLTKEFTGE